VSLVVLKKSKLPPVILLIELSISDCVATEPPPKLIFAWPKILPIPPVIPPIIPPAALLIALVIPLKTPPVF
jgi:hypothetical protein